MGLNSHPSDLAARFRAHLVSHALLPADQPVAVAVSGRSDSVALAHLLAGTAAVTARLSLLHIQHLKAADHEHDAAFVTSLAERLRLPLEVIRDESAGASEDERQQRRAPIFAGAAARAGAVISTGETADDLVEGFLESLLSETALPEALTERADGIVRPLLPFSHHDCVEFLQTRRLPFRRSRSAVELVNQRYRIRLLILPILKRHVRPDALPQLARGIKDLAAEAALVQEIATAARFEVGWLKTADALSMEADRLRNLPAPLRRRLLADALAALRPDQRITRPELDAAEHACRSLTDGATVAVGPLTVGCSRGRLLLRMSRSMEPST